MKCRWTRSRYAFANFSSSLGPLFHANHYMNLNVPAQDLHPDSTRRIKRIRELPPADEKEGILSILGDQADAEYPIFHDLKSRPHEHADNSWTLVTAYFDLDAKKMELYQRNPTLQKLIYEVDVGSGDVGSGLNLRQKQEEGEIWL